MSFNRNKKIRAKFGGKCGYCGKPNTALTVDHIMPRAENGKNKIHNLLPSCLVCNSAKASMSVDQFRGRLQNRHHWGIYWPETLVKYISISYPISGRVAFYFEPYAAPLYSTGH